MSMRLLLSDKSPVVKRNIARSAADNIPTSTKVINLEGVLPLEGPRLKEIVHVLAANLNRLIAREKTREGLLVSNAKIGKATGISSNTIGRMRRGDGRATVGSIAKVARAFKIQPFEMLYPGLDADAPPEFVSDPQERDLLRAFRGKPPTQH